MEKKKSKQVRPPVPRYGGKYTHSRKIIAEFPKHQTYLEPFGGGGSVLLGKSPGPVETYNDLDLQITRIFRVLRRKGEEFIRQLQVTPYSEVEFKDAATLSGSEVEKAVATFIRLRQSFAALEKNWRYSRGSSAKGMSQTVSHWLTAIDALPEIIQRLKRVQITCQPAIEAVKRFDSPDTLIYCDPPYLHETRAKGARDTYAVEMTNQQHRELAMVLNSCKSKVIISGCGLSVQRTGLPSLPRETDRTAIYWMTRPWVALLRWSEALWQFDLGRVGRALAENTKRIWPLIKLPA